MGSEMCIRDRIPAIHVDLIVAATNQDYAYCYGNTAQGMTGTKVAANKFTSAAETGASSRWFGIAEGNSAFNSGATKCTWLYHVHPTKGAPAFKLVRADW